MIGNPAAASSAAGDTWKATIEPLKHAGLDIDSVATQSKGHGIQLAFEAAGKGYRCFLSAGGDGTLHEVMTGLLRYCDATSVSMEEFTVGVLPYGTGNDWLRSTGIPGNLEAAMKAVVEGNTSKEDVVRVKVDGQVYCMVNMGGMGVDAAICHDAKKLKQRGLRGNFVYKLAALYSAYARKCCPVEVRCDGELVYQGKLFSATIGNGAYRGGGHIQTAPDTRWDDGLLDLCIMPHANLLRESLFMIHCLHEDIASQSDVICRKFKRMEVKPLGKSGTMVEIDGGYRGLVPLTVELTGEQINIVSGLEHQKPSGAEIPGEHNA